MLIALGATGAPRPVLAQENAEVRSQRALKSSVAVDYSYESFAGSIDPWQLSSASIGQRTSHGSVIGRVNHARRFGESGYQAEMDVYPRLSPSVYAYLNLGYSGSGVFPAWRSGAELFTSLPHAWEASAGYRQLRFGGGPVTLITGSVGRYVGNYWLSLRPYLRPTGAGTSASSSLTARRYFEDGEHYVGARAGFGSAPSDQIAPDQVARTSSFTAGVHGSTGLGAIALGTWSLSYDRDELSPDTYRNGTTVTAGLKWRF